MITSKSRKREIRDLQRLLLAVGLMELTSEDEDGKWGNRTHAAVLLAYDATRLGSSRRRQVDQCAGARRHCECVASARCRRQ